MGNCSSCCRRRKSPEREPLLPRVPTHSSDVLPPPVSKIEKIADVLAAINAGKLPSQDQIDAALKLALASDALQPAVVLRGYGPLSESGKKVIRDVRELVNALLRTGVEKNSDNKLQDLMYHLERIDSSSVNADVAVNVKDDSALSELESVVQDLPSSQEIKNDTQTLVQSLRRLTHLLLTSSAFRLILSDTLHTVREMLADAASEVSTVALRAGVTAGEVEDTIRPGGVNVDVLEDVARKLQQDMEAVREVAGEREERLKREGPERVREDAILRLQQTMVAVHRNPQYRQAFQTILFILTKYANKLNSMSATLSTAASQSSEAHVTITPVVWADEHVAAALSDLRVLLERFASGSSLDSVLRLLNQTINHLSSPDNEESKMFLTRIGKWIDTALGDASYAVSEEGTLVLEGLYNNGRNLLAEESNKLWAQDLRGLSEETHKFIAALQEDKTTQQFFASLDTLSSDFAQLTTDALTSGRQWSAEAQRDLLGWLLPRLLKALLGVIPSPRIEYKSKTLDIVLDAGRLELGVGSSVLPDRVVVQNWSEVRLEAVNVDENVIHAAAHEDGVQSFARFKAHTDGVRLYAHDIGYHVRYKGLMGYEDQGLVSVDVGSRYGQGLSISVEVETASDSWLVASRTQSGGEEALFRVVDVKVVVPGLSFSLDKSRHWVLNKVMVQPLAGPVVRLVLTRVFEDKIREALQAVAGWMGKVKKDVERKGGEAGVEEYWGAVLASAGVSPEESEGEDEEGPEMDEEPLVETHTKPTLKGIVRTVTQPDPAASNPPTPVLAVGVGPQVLDDSAGPYGGYSEEQGALDEVRERADEVQENVDDAIQRSGAGIEEATGAVVQNRVEVRRRVESRRRGWRSRAFDV
ncbi:hypothetical protein NEOLEDRAFT_1238916 [Neolentinus lepideus HHB14362 ss-1]|uniref:Uncharacterized protein n=1 Tax=Neolentinus lepideus HHB14362 ss-1 TaxID=1314782 RepID=A0A165VD97_9AGAM|nr:hypothetical protein NEOLEDRAFT_1238916 [Neolentinus lepideus HHB14362 ss-1]